MKYLVLSFITLITVSICLSQPNGLPLTTTAPDFSAPDQSGKTITLRTELKKGKVILVFYRGEWCPFCNKELNSLQDSLTFITAKGATVIAISPEKSENILKTVEKTKATYSLLHDSELKIMKAYDVAFTVDAATVEKYKSYGLSFDKMNGDNGANLPIPAVYIIDKSGKIIYRYFDADYRKRPSVKELLTHL